MAADSIRALQVSKTDKGQTIDFVTLAEADLGDGDVTVAVEHSTVNYKDGLAITGKAPIIRKFPLVPGIDFAGIVTRSNHQGIKTGDRVILNGWGVGEDHNGGYADKARVPGGWLVPLPENMTTAEAMAVGTAGYTAMLCIMALEQHELRPESGEILVTGAAGGVGSIAIAILSRLGYTVVASTGRTEEGDFLKSLGAARIIDRGEFAAPVKPLAKARWAGAIDAVGSTTLANVLSQMMPEATVAACGLAQGMDLPSSVAPFILRGVKLIGVNSVTCPLARRLEAWRRISRDLDLAKLKALTTHVKLDDVPRIAADIVAARFAGAWSSISEAGVDLELILVTMAIGIAVEAPLGAVNLIVIRATLRSGFAGGLAAASGSILGDAAFAVAIAFGIREIGDLVVRYGLLLQIAGGVLLLVMGIETFRTHVADKALRLEGPARDPLWRKAVSAFILTITNPATFMGMVAIFGGVASMIHLASSPARPWFALLGVMAGALVWWVLVALLVRRLSKKLTGAALDKLNRWTGIGIVGFGLAVLANVALRLA